MKVSASVHAAYEAVLLALSDVRVQGTDGLVAIPPKSVSKTSASWLRRGCSRLMKKFCALCSIKIKPDFFGKGVVSWLKKVLILSSSLRPDSNSEQLAREAGRGALEAGNDVEVLSLAGRDIRYCEGCMACHRLLYCPITDDANDSSRRSRKQTPSSLLRLSTIMTSAAS